MTMHRAVRILAACAVLFSLAACGHTGKTTTTAPTGAPESTAPSASESDTAAPAAESPEASAEAAVEPSDRANNLIVYFSWSPSGNTEKMAYVIQERTGGDILEIEPMVAYPTEYSVCGEVAKVERDENIRPEIANLPESLDEYDTIFVGYPIWWHTAPMTIGTFLENYDLTGKEIYPFSQSASMDTEQFANSMDFVRTSAKGAAVHEGLFADASDTDKILAYLTENGFAE